MALRSCLCYRKCHASSSQQQKRSISLYIKQQQQQRSALTQQQQQHATPNHKKHISLRHKYPGLLLHYPRQQQRLFTASVNSIGKQLEKLDLQQPHVITTTNSQQQQRSWIDDFRKDLDRLLNNEFPIKGEIWFYRRLVKFGTANDLYNLFSAKLDSMEYDELRDVLRDAAAYWSVETIHQVMSLCDGKYVNWRLNMLNLLLSSYTLNRNLNHLIGALPTFNTPREDVLPFYNTVLNKCLKQKQYHHVQKVLDLMKERGIDPDTASFNILIRMKLSTQVNNKTPLQPQQMFDIYKDMISQGVQPSRATFNTFIKYACQNHHWESLKAWLDMMEEDSIEPSPVTARILFRSYVTHPNSAELSEAFERVSSAVPLMDKERFLNTGVAALLKAKQTKAAMDILDKTFTLDEPLSVYSYNLLIQALCLEGKLDTAQQILDSMVLKQQDNNNNNNRIPKPDIVSFTTLINGLVRNNQHVKLNQLHTLYKQLMDQGLRTNNVLESVILYGLLRSENNDKMTRAKTLFESILANKDRVTSPRQHADTNLEEINIYNIMMDFYFLHYHQSKSLRHQTPQEPFVLLQDAVENKKLKPTVTTLNILVRGLAILNKDLNAAEKMVTYLKDKGVSMDEKTVWYLTKSAYSQGQMSRACRWIETYESLDKSIKGSGLNHLKSILTKWDKKEEEEKVLE